MKIGAKNPTIKLITLKRIELVFLSPFPLISGGLLTKVFIHSSREMCVLKLVVIFDYIEVWFFGGTLCSTNCVHSRHESFIINWYLWAHIALISYHFDKVGLLLLFCTILDVLLIFCWRWKCTWKLKFFWSKIFLVFIELPISSWSWFQNFGEEFTLRKLSLYKQFLWSQKNWMHFLLLTWNFLVSKFFYLFDSGSSGGQTKFVQSFSLLKFIHLIFFWILRRYWECELVSKS